MLPNKLEFCGLVLFSGVDHLPDDILLNLDSIRQWAFKQDLVSDPEFQLLLDDRLQNIAKCFSSDDKPQIAIALNESREATHEAKEGLSYMEYPFLPVKTLIQRGEKIKIVYWVMQPSQWDVHGNVLQFGEVRFGFWYPSCQDEFCSLSNAEIITQKFNSLLTQLSNDCPADYPVRSFKDGSKEITVDGVVRARFLKKGRFFDVDLSLTK